MPSVFALRAVLGASLGFGALDLVWINAVLGPRLEPPAAPVAAALVPAPVAVAVEAVEPAEPVAVQPALRTGGTQRLYFATRSARLDANARAELAALAKALGPDAQLVLEGHADYRGEQAFNLSLSKARAEAVQAELVLHGVPAHRIEVRYAGEGTATGPDLWRDRRVDLQLRGAR